MFSLYMAYLLSYLTNCATFYLELSKLSSGFSGSLEISLSRMIRERERKTKGKFLLEIGRE
jgi:hypothetical protein